jgi:DNA-binding transcriptional LysR family regulator
MDLRQLRYFLVLADELHFRRAAERLNITQAPLSLAIQALERELGALLFNRTNRRVELTEGGIALRIEATAILERVQRSRETIRDLADGITGSIRLGVTPACCLMPFFGNLVSAFRSGRPKVRVTLHELSSRDQLIALQARELDAAILRNPPRRFATGISLTRLTTDPRDLDQLRHPSGRRASGNRNGTARGLRAARQYHPRWKANRYNKQTI